MILRITLDVNRTRIKLHAVSLSQLIYLSGWWATSPSTWNMRLKRRLWHTCAYNVWTVRVSDKVQLRLRAFQRAIDKVRTFPSKCPKNWMGRTARNSWPTSLSNCPKCPSDCTNSLSHSLNSSVNCHYCPIWGSGITHPLVWRWLICIL